MDGQTYDKGLNYIPFSTSTGVILELSDREKISGFQGEVLVQILDFPIHVHSVHFHFYLPQLKIGRSQPA